MHGHIVLVIFLLCWVKQLITFLFSCMLILYWDFIPHSYTYLNCFLKRHFLIRRLAAEICLSVDSPNLIDFQIEVSTFIFFEGMSCQLAKRHFEHKLYKSHFYFRFFSLRRRIIYIGDEILQSEILFFHLRPQQPWQQLVRLSLAQYLIR